MNDDATIGGLVGNNLSGASIANSSASGNVTGGDGTTAGGLVGFNAFGNTITASHATGNVSIDNPGLTAGSRAASSATTKARSQIPTPSATSAAATDVARRAGRTSSGAITNSHATAT